MPRTQLIHCKHSPSVLTITQSFKIFLVLEVNSQHFHSSEKIYIQIPWVPVLGLGNHGMIMDRNTSSSEDWRELMVLPPDNTAMNSCPESRPPQINQPQHRWSEGELFNSSGIARRFTEENLDILKTRRIIVHRWFWWNFCTNVTRSTYIIHKL